MEQMLSDVRDMNVADTTVANIPGKNITYITTLQDTQLKFRQVFTLKDDVAYIITFSAPIAVHDACSSLVDSCVATFALVAKRGLGSACLQPFLNKDYAYFIRVPKGWERKEFKNGSVQRFDKKDSSGKVTLIVAVDFFPQNSLDAYTKLVRNQIQHATSGSEVAVISDTQLAGTAAKRTSYYSSSMLLPGRYNQIWTVKDKFAGVITLVHNVEVWVYW